MHHIELYVSDLEASRRFWGWFLKELGYKEYQKWSSGISWKKDRFYLVIVQAKEPFLEPEYHRCRVGLNHLAFHAESKLQVDPDWKIDGKRLSCVVPRQASFCRRRRALCSLL